MSKLERLSDRFLRVGRHPFKIFQRTKNKQQNTGYDEPDLNDTQVCFCCHSDSHIYSRCWPLIFIFSAITDFPMPLPKGKKPGQHRDWGWIPILFVSAFSVYVYYAYFDRIILVLLNKLDKKPQAIIYLVFFNIWFLLYIITYARIVSKKPGNAKSLQSSSSDINTEEIWSESKVTTVATVESSSIIDPEQRKSMKIRPDSILGDSKWCESCQLWKPDRTHHCRVCNTCVLRMDHHCPWINGCVGNNNYRFYIQFLCYVSGLCAWIFSTSLAAFIQYNSLSTFDRMALSVLIISGIVTVVIGTFTLSHLWLVLLNRTTIENTQFQSWRKAKKNGSAKERLIHVFTESGRNVFNQGHKKNWVEVMGDNVLLWFLPLSSQDENDGVHFGYNADILSEYKREDSSRRNNHKNGHDNKIFPK